MDSATNPNQETTMTTTRTLCATCSRNLAEQVEQGYIYPGDTLCFLHKPRQPRAPICPRCLYWHGQTCEEG